MAPPCTCCNSSVVAAVVLFSELPCRVFFTVAWHIEKVCLSLVAGKVDGTFYSTYLICGRQFKLLSITASVLLI